jgi:hypothetical protein
LFDKQAKVQNPIIIRVFGKWVGVGEEKRLMKCVCVYGRKNRTKPNLGTIGYTPSADSIK